MEITIDNYTETYRYQIPKYFNPYVKIIQNPIHSCKWCTRAYLQEDQLQLHESENHVLKNIKVEYVNILTCNTTHKQQNVPDYGLHKITHTEKNVNQTLFSCNPNGTDRFIKRFQCKECRVKFVHESTLADHSVLHQPFPHVCDCGIGFYQKKALIHHKQLVHPSKPALKQKGIADTNKLKNKTKSPKLSNTLTCSKPESTIKLQLKTVPEDKIPRNENNQFHCLICKKVLACKKEFQIHVKSHNKEKPYKCEKCDKGYVQYNLLVVHMRKHMGIENFKCTFCEKEFKNLSLLQSHERKHTGEKPYVCSYCGKAFSLRSTFTKHNRMHTEGKTKQCHVCMKSFFTQNEVKRHFMAVHDKIKRFECELCYMKFLYKSTLTKHYNNIHLGIKKYECDYCGIKQASKYNLKMHILKMHMNTEYCIDSNSVLHEPFPCVEEMIPTNENNQFHCPICKKVLACKTGFQIHLKSHNRKKSYKCEKCNKGYIRYNSLVVHMRKHMGIEDFKCTLSEKELNNLSLLQSQERTHTGEKCAHTEGKTKQCHVCMKMFFSQDEVKRHFIMVHDEVKKFECDVCNKKFTEKGTLRKHYNNIHLGIKRYECDYCGIKQASKYNLKTHILKMHMNNKRLN